MSIRDWYPILRWDTLPNFGLCHTATTSDEFKRNYAESKEIRDFRENLLETLGGSFDTPNMRILGKPGTGKTTFLYSLLSLNGQNLDKYFLYIFHVNRAVGDDPEPLVIEELFGAWGAYFNSCGFDNEFNSIKSQKITTKLKLTKCSDFFLKRKKDFKKVFIVALDNVDLLEPKIMGKIALLSITHLEVASVKKWLFIREESYDKYDQETRRLVSQFFPEARHFPIIKLFEIVEHRINNTPSKGKPLNPFSNQLCERVQLMYDDCLRESLPTLKTILENSFKSGFHQNQDVSFISNYIDRAAITILTETGKLPNLHSIKYRNVPYTIPIELVSMMMYIQSIQLLLGSVNHIINFKRANLPAKNRELEIKLPNSTFMHSLNLLIQNGLATKNDESVYLTPIGKVVAASCGKKFYAEACFHSLLPNSLTSSEYSGDYQLMSFMEMDYENIARIWTTKPI